MVELVLRPNFDFGENSDKAALISDFERIKAALSRIDTDVETLSVEASSTPLAPVGQPVIALAEYMTLPGGTSYQAAAQVPGFAAGKLIAVGPSFSGPVWTSITLTTYLRSGLQSYSHAIAVDDDASGTLHTISAIFYAHLPPNFTGWSPSGIEADLCVIDSTAPSVTYSITATINGTSSGTFNTAATAPSSLSMTTVRILGSDLPSSAPGYTLALTLTITGASSSNSKHHFGEVRVNWK